MGLLDFVKDAGDELLKRVGARDEVDATAVAESVRKHGLRVDDLSISVDGDQALVSGRVKSQAEREKVLILVGNTKGVARVDDAIQVERPEPESKYYKVKKGDSLSKIAKSFYGDPMKYPVLFEANQPMLKDPDRIYPGQVLRIPPLGD